MGLRLLIPWILVITGIANVGFRWLPPERVAFRSWEAVTLFNTSNGPFTPEKQYVNPAATGDLGTLANLPEFRRPHLETFTTGPHGYRGYEPGVSPAPAAILFGDSFGAGASLTDGDTLCSRLTPVFGGPVFFGGHLSARTVADVQRLPRAPYVILQISESLDLATLQSGDDGGVPALVKRLTGDHSVLYLRARYLRDLATFSPMAIWAERIYQNLQNGEVLPNIQAHNVQRYMLPNHEELLFLGSEVHNFYSPPPVHLDSLLAIARQIESTGSRVIAVLVPSKFTVYYPLIRNIGPGPPDDRLFVNVLERELRKTGVPVVNFTPALRRAAKEALAENELVYRLDDTHWNAAGVAAAAEQLQRALDAGELAPARPVAPRK